MQWILSKIFSPLLAFVWLLSCVDSPMLRKLWTVCKAFPTLLTFVSFLSCMHSLMANKVWIQSKTFLTFLTSVWFLSRVDPIVTHKHWILRKTFPSFYSFSSVWTLLCCKSCECQVKKSANSGHLYGFSLVWTLLWLTRCDFWMKHFSHSWHLYGFSPVSASWCHLVHMFIPFPLSVEKKDKHRQGWSPSLQGKEPQWAEKRLNNLKRTWRERFKKKRHYVHFPTSPYATVL